MGQQVELGDLPAQAVVDEALRQHQEEVTSHGGEGALDVEAVFEDALQHGSSDQAVVVGLGRDGKRPGAEELAAAAARLVLGVVDVEVGDLAVGQRADTTVEGAFAAAVLAAGGAGVTLGGAADDADNWHEHGLCSHDAEGTRRCRRTQALSFNLPSAYVCGCLSPRWG